MTNSDITHEEMLAILRRLEKNQNNIKIGQRVLSDQLEKLQEAQLDAEQFRSHAKAFGGYGAENIRNKLRARGDQISQASIEKAHRYWRAAAAQLST